MVPYERSHLPRGCRRLLRHGGLLLPLLRPSLNAMETIVTGIIAIALLAYLFAAMVRPEKF
jgi:K+-transporting ATPase KdpF subunit